MLSFLQSIACPFGRCIRKTDNVSHSPRRKQTNKQLAIDYGEAEGNVTIPRINVLSPTLPELTDCGTLTAHLCESDHLYWNSTLLEGETDVNKGHLYESENDRGSKNQGLANTATFNASEKEKDAELQSPKETSDHKYPSTLQWDGISKQSPLKLHNDQARDSRRVTDTSAKNKSPESHFISPRPPRIMAINTQERKELIPLPPKRVLHLKRYPSGGKLNSSSVHVNENAITATNPEGPSLSPAIPLSPLTSLPPAPPVNGVSHESHTNGEILTWDFALQKILSNECVNDATREEVRKRLQTSQSMNGIQNEGQLPSVMGASGLVPNFSHPIAGSRFSDREENEPQRALTNGIEKAEEKTYEQLTNGISPEQHFDFASEASSHHKQCCITHPADRVSDRINHLLSEELTQSELSLHDEVVVTTSSNYPPCSPTSMSGSKAQLVVPRGGRLIYKLHRIIHGLQDRVNGLEDTLIPQLSTALEHKSYTVKELRLQLASLEEIVNTSSRFLNRCYRREKELLHTLDDLRAKKIRNGSSDKGFKKWVKRSKYVSVASGANEAESSKAHEKATRDANLNHLTDHVLQGGQKMASKKLESYANPQTCSINGLPKKDLSIVFDIALQNVQMLAEDMGQMSTLITEWANLVEPKDEVEPIPGSWRDV